MLQKARDKSRDWAAGRLSLEYPPADDDGGQPIDSAVMEHHKSEQADRPPLPEDSLLGASSPELLHSVMATLQQVFLLILKYPRVLCD